MNRSPETPDRRRLVIVGGVAGGMSAAARARRLDERAEIVVLEHVDAVMADVPRSQQCTCR
ncbi:hypothetical protein HP550_11095 [Cellulomonas humilata]|uniref:FAD/NAD(P)-binding domain-containing protein n=1 Tax=Cellulomonas humilata TaxID=144055 RepID=A0A7Y6A3G1_9CELL|nr:hypothetical protein [Cellulomonas humilata]NUU17794.1 hypothetical protein [Cellulomonas humilata]